VTIMRRAEREVRHRPARPSTKRLDIQGLRAIAVTAVVLAHVEVFGFVGGFVGVDVFFVISGFLITGHLVRGLLAEGRVGFLEFYANRIRRLLPAATAVLLVTAVATRLVLPSTRWMDINWEILGSALYVENWVLAANSVDYMTQDSLPSPVQHFWSLAVEEQFYLLWPVAIAVAAAAFVMVYRWRAGQHVGRRRFFLRRPRALRWTLVGGLALIALPSFAWSVHDTASHPAPAYFVTTARLWELAIGGFVAILAVEIRRMPSQLAACLTWAGLAGIVCSVIVIDSDTPFPGSAAALPTLATAAVIAGGSAAGRLGAGRLLSIRPAQFLGDISYSVYPWHWPLVIIVRARFGSMTTTLALLVIAAAITIGYASYRWIETPLRDPRTGPLRSTQAYGGAVAMVALSAVVALLVVGTPASEREEQDLVARGQAAAALESSTGADAVTGGEQQRLGAAVLPVNPRDARAGAPRDAFPTLVPGPANALADQVSCQTTPVGSSEVTSCPFGDPDSAVHVVLIGDSHAAQWLSALEPIAEQRGWRLTAYIHDSCPFAAGSLTRDGKPYSDCIAWNEAVTRQALADDPTAVFTSNYTDSAAVPGDASTMAAAHRAAWQPFLDRDVPVVVIRDNPQPGTINVAECAAVHENELTKCDFPRGPATEDRGVAQMLAAKGTTGVIAIDLTDAICPTDPCAAAIGQVLVYRDTNHLTGTYVLSLRPRIEAAIKTVPGL
jgi:peptidoglycan/LPS O-acetylase OafA/YrhL